jgi:hypothetical protein
MPVFIILLVILFLLFKQMKKLNKAKQDIDLVIFLNWIKNCTFFNEN